MLAAVVLIVGDTDVVVAVVCRCLTQLSSRTMRHCLCISSLRTLMKLTALTMRLCTTSVSVHWSWQLQLMVISTTWSLPPCLVSPLASASQARYTFTTSLVLCTGIIGSKYYSILTVIVGRPFVKRFAPCYQTIASALSVYNVGVLWPNSWRDHNET